MALVKPGDTLEQRLKDPAYKNWLKAGMCLFRAKEGLETFVDAKSKALHLDILKKHTPCGQCPQDGFKKKKKEKLLCLKCCSFKHEIVSRHNGNPNWENTDVQNFPHDHWSVAKCFMNPGQNGKKSASDTDVSGLLNFIIFCKKFNDFKKYGDIQKNAENVREDRNCLLHSGHDQLSDADLKSYTSDMLKLLMDENPDGKLKGNNEAEKAKIQIQEVLKVNFVILHEDEYKVKLDALEGRVDHINEELEKVKQGDVIKVQEIEKMAERVRDLEKKYKQVKAKIDKIQEDHDEVQTLKAGFAVQDTRIQNLSERVESKFSFITQQIKEKLDEMNIRIDEMNIRNEEVKSKVEHLEAVTRDHGEKIEELYVRVPKEDEISEKEIDRLKEDLKSCYKSLSTVPISAFNEKETIPLEEFYVDMDITLEHQTEDREKVEFSSYKQIFLERRNQRIILTGLSGSGKSTFCRRMVNTWCMEEPKKENKTSETTDPSIPDSQKALIGIKEKYQLVPESPAAIGDQNNDLSISRSCDALTDEEIGSHVSDPSEFVIDRELLSSVRDSSEAIQDQDILLQFLLFYIYAPNISTEKTLIEVLYNHCLKSESDQLSKIIEEQPEKMLIILDGMDEMGDNIPQVLYDLIHRKLHPRIIVLMVMRPWKISQLELRSFSGYELLLEVQGLSKTGVRKFVQNVINVNKTYMTVERTTAGPTYKEMDVLSSLGKVPILVLFLAHIWCQNKCLPKRRHDLYTKVLECLIKRCLNKTKNKYIPALTDQDDINMKKEQFWELYINGACQAAHDFLLKGVSGPSVVMQEKELMNKLGTDAQLKLGALLDCGILSKQDAFSPLEKNVSVTFLHFSVHEFLTSKHLVSNDVAFQNFLTSVKTLNDVFRYENLFIFICGHDTNKGHEAFTRICQVCDEDPLIIQYRQEMCKFQHTDSITNLKEMYRACLNEMDNEEHIEISDIYFERIPTIEMSRLRSYYVKSLNLCHIELHLDTLYCLTNLTYLKLYDVTLLGGVLELSKLSNLTSLTMNRLKQPYSVLDLRSLTKLTFLDLCDLTMFDGVLDLNSLTNLTSLKLCNVTIPDGVLHLSSLTNLTFLSLRKVTIPDGVLHLSSLTNLTFLSLINVTIADDVLDLRMPNLASLELHDVSMSERCSRCLCSSICLCTRLETIRLSGITLYDDVLDLKGLTNMISITMEKVAMSETCCRSVFSSISGCTHLDHLELRSIMLHDSVLDLSSLTNLSYLKLTAVTMSEKCSRSVCSSISGWTYLDHLELKRIMLYDCVLDLSSLTNLSSLYLISVTMSKKCTQNLCSNLSFCTHLKNLMMSNITLYDGALDLSNLTNLTELSLSDVKMSKECSRSVCSSISGWTYLDHLELKRIMLYDCVLDLSSLTNLSSLYLISVTMSKKCTQNLCSSLSFCTHLKNLMMSNITLYDGALDLSNLTNLTELSLSDVKMSKECSRSLCTSISACSRLRYLQMDNIRLKYGVLDLIDLTGLKHLLLLTIVCVTMSPQCYKRLRERLVGRHLIWKIQF